MSMVYEATSRCGERSSNENPGPRTRGFFHSVRGMIGQAGVVKKQQPEPKLRTVVSWFNL